MARLANMLRMKITQLNNLYGNKMPNISRKITISAIVIIALALPLSLSLLYMFSDNEKHGYISNISELDYLIKMPFKEFPNNGRMYYEYKLFFPRFNKEIKIYGNIKVSLMEKFIKRNVLSSQTVENYVFDKKLPSALNWNLTRDKRLDLPFFAGKVYILDSTWDNRSFRFIINKKSGKFIAKILQGSSKT
jgi:hypothetical protein